MSTDTTSADGPRPDPSADAAPSATRARVLLVGRSQLVLTETTALLHQRGHHAQATNRFDAVLTAYDTTSFDVIVFGGQVPPDTREHLTRAIAATNPSVIFVRGLAGIPGLITAQVEAALQSKRSTPDASPVYDPAERVIRLELQTPGTVTITAWWQTSFVPPDPKSTSRVLLDHEPGTGQLRIPIPHDIPDTAAFAVVDVDGAIYPLTLTPPRP